MLITLLDAYNRKSNKSIISPEKFKDLLEKKIEASYQFPFLSLVLYICVPTSMSQPGFVPGLRMSVSPQMSFDLPFCGDYTTACERSESASFSLAHLHWTDGMSVFHLISRRCLKLSNSNSQGKVNFCFQLVN